MKSNEAFRHSPDVVSRRIGDEIVLMDLESGTYFGLNQVGSRVWELTDAGPQSLSALRDRIVEEFDVADEVAEQDLIKLLGQLASRGLLIAEPTSA